MEKETYILPITNSPFSNNHFKIVKNILTNHKEVIIFLLLDSNDKSISLEDKKNIIECYFNEEELKQIEIIDSLVTNDENIVALVNEIRLLSANSNKSIHLLMDLKYSRIIAEKCLNESNLDNSVFDIQFYVHTKAQLFDVKKETLFTREPVLNVDLNNIMSFNMNLNAFNYILEHNLFFTNKIKSFIDGHRLKHSISVANLCYKVAEANHLKDPYRYFISGLLHDIGKHVDNVIEKRIMYKHFHDFIDLPSFSYHQYVGSYLCRKDFHINDEEVLEAIKCHCTGKANMSLMAKILYACDKIDPLRGYDSSDMINAMMKDAESGFLYVLSENLLFLKTKTNLELDSFDRLSKECFNFYLYK